MQAFSGVKDIKIFGVFVNQVYGISQSQQKVDFYSCSLVKLRKFLIYWIEYFTGEKIRYVSIPLTPFPLSPLFPSHSLGHVPPPFPPPPTPPGHALSWWVSDFLSLSPSTVNVR